MSNTRKIGIIVMARMQSTRLPGKALKKIGKYFSLELCLLNCKKVKKIDKLVLATTNLKKDKLLIKKFKKKFSIFSGDSKNVLKRLLDICKKYDFKDIVRVTGDCPFISPDIIRILIKNHKKGKPDMTMAKRGAVGTHCEVFKVDALKEIYRKANSMSYSEYLPYYFFQNKKRFNIKKVNLPPTLIRNYRITLDYEKDLNMFNAMIKKSDKRAEDLTTYDIFRILDQNPKIVKIVSGLKLKYRNKDFQAKLKKFTNFKKDIF